MLYYKKNVLTLILFTKCYRLLLFFEINNTICKLQTIESVLGCEFLLMKHEWNISEYLHCMLSFIVIKYSNDVFFPPMLSWWTFPLCGLFSSYLEVHLLLAGAA